MSRSPYAADQAGGQVSGLVAPIKGLNTQVPLAGLSPEYAITLDNFICQPDALVTRTGLANHKTGFAKMVKTLFTHVSGTASKLFGATDDGIFDATAAGAAGATVAALTSGWGKAVNFATSAGQYAYFVNGVDQPWHYDGTTWAHPVITVATSTTLWDIEVYRSRLYFLQVAKLGFWYLPADSIAGAAAFFNIGALCRMGGYATAQGTWTIDGGNGPDDYYAVATSEGEVCVFKGSDPSVVADWTYVGTYYLGRPLGQYSFAKGGGDLLYLCENGIIPMSSMTQTVSKNYDSAITRKIQPSIQSASSLYRALRGWQVHIIPSKALLLLNVPLTTTTSMQFCYNTVSKGWSTLSGIHAHCFCEFNGVTYSGGATAVVKTFTGTADFGAAITAICDTAYNRFGTRAQLQPLLVRALWASTANTPYTVGVAQDFSGVYNENTYGTSGVVAGVWDTGLWDTAVWGGNFALNRDWVTIAAKGGIALSTRFKVTSLTASSIFLAIDYKFAEQGLVS